MTRWLLLLVPTFAFAQDFTQRGYLNFRGFAFPQRTYNDRANFVGEALFHYEFERSLVANWRIAGATETRLDTHHQVERRFYVNWSDRSLQRPAFSARRLSFIYQKRRFTAEIGKQPIRWGKADILNPTDRFAPRDFLAVVDNEFLYVTAARAIYEAKSDSFEVVLQPRFTPSRAPLLNQRWTVLPEEFRDVPVNDLGARVPRGPQFGARWNHLGSGYEMSLSIYDGHNHLPNIDGSFDLLSRSAAIQRWYPQLRQYGGDVAVPLKWLTAKAEVGYYTTTSPNTDEYVIYVLQAERQQGELSLVGGYAGEWVTDRKNPLQFAPDRGLTKSFLGRASYTLNPRQSVAVEYVIRQNGDGAWVRSEFSQTFGQHWRATAGFTAIAGSPTDFLGQYRRNSHISANLRYSF
jgi:hypothetical protein